MQAPAFKASSFNCPYCGAYAAQLWAGLHTVTGGLARRDDEVMMCECSHCGKHSYWYEERMVVPDSTSVVRPHSDLPAECVVEYEEARGVFSRSPRAAAALLRLCIQKLMPHLGTSGQNINNDIRALVADGLPATVQKALDVCRVVGNHAVHPGEIDLNDTPEIAEQLFHMINFVVADRITRPREIEEIYGKLPESSRAAIAQRDGSSPKG